MPLAFVREVWYNALINNDRFDMQYSESSLDSSWVGGYNNFHNRRKARPERFVVFGILGTLSFAATALLLTNISDNKIIPNLFGAAAEQGLSEAINIIFASVAITTLLAGIAFGLSIKNVDVTGDEKEMELHPGVGLLMTLPLVNLALCIFSVIIADPADRAGDIKNVALYLIPYTLGVAAIVGSALAIGFAEEIHQYFLNNVAELPVDLSNGLANILTPDHILGMGIGIISLVSIPLIHTFLTANIFDISFETPEKALFNQIYVAIKYGDEGHDSRDWSISD